MTISRCKHWLASASYEQVEGLMQLSVLLLMVALPSWLRLVEDFWLTQGKILTMEVGKSFIILCCYAYSSYQVGCRVTFLPYPGC